MAKKYRSWSERRAIIRAVIAESSDRTVESFDLSDSELVYYRARSAKLIDRFAARSSTFKSYYALPTAKPFGWVVAFCSVVAGAAFFAALYLKLHYADGGATMYPLFGALAAVMVAAIGWAVSGWTTHRNTIRQNTNNILFARFSHAPFGDALHRFHDRFDDGCGTLITRDMMQNLRDSDEEDDRKIAAAVTYILNYYEFVSSGVLHGDLNADIVRDNIRGLVIYYFDKCGPYIRSLQKQNHRAYANLAKLRTHYREP